jgi:hypothetical protein
MFLGTKMESQWIVCVQCEMEFEFDEAEQLRHADLGFDVPRRCSSCRKHKSKIMNGWELKMFKSRKKNFQRHKTEDSWR